MPRPRTLTLPRSSVINLPSTDEESNPDDSQFITFSSIFGQAIESIKEVFPDSNDNSFTAEDCRFGSCPGRQSTAKTQIAALLPKFTIGSMQAPCPNHEAAKILTTESLTPLAYALNCIDCKNNHGYVKTYTEGRDFMSHFNKNYADMVYYYKWGGDFLGDVNSDADE